LRVCGLPGTRVTAEGVKALAKAVPRCKIYWDGGTIEPTEKEPDRAAAELVLDLGGKVLVSGTDHDIALAADLPKGPFRLLRITIPKLAKPLTPAELALFKGLTHLEWLSGTGPGFDDATLLAFADSKKLALVYVPYAKITDAGLAIFKDNCTLALLNVDGSTITDAGLDHLATCGRLENLAVGSGPTDAGLEKLKRHPRLTALILGGPKVTEAGIKDFAKAVPRCKITWDGGVVEPTEKVSADRKAAEWVLSVGGKVGTSANGRDGNVARAADLPSGAFVLKRVELTRCREVTDEGLAVFAGCHGVTHLSLDHTPITGAGLRHFAACKHLAKLDATGTQLTDAGLAHIGDLDGLLYVYLGGTKVTEVGLKHLRKSTGLTALFLNGIALTNDGWAALGGFPRLANLSVHQTGATAKAVTDFAKAVPRCKIHWDGGVVEPTEPK